jgi:hypothetical protein
MSSISDRGSEDPQEASAKAPATATTAAVVRRTRCRVILPFLGMCTAS